MVNSVDEQQIEKKSFLSDIHRSWPSILVLGICMRVVMVCVVVVRVVCVVVWWVYVWSLVAHYVRPWVRNAMVGVWTVLWRTVRMLLWVRMPMRHRMWTYTRMLMLRDMGAIGTRRHTQWTMRRVWWARVEILAMVGCCVTTVYYWVGRFLVVLVWVLVRIWVGGRVHVWGTGTSSATGRWSCGHAASGNSLK